MCCYKYTLLFLCIIISSRAIIKGKRCASKASLFFHIPEGVNTDREIKRWNEVKTKIILNELLDHLIKIKEYELSDRKNQGIDYDMSKVINYLVQMSEEVAVDLKEAVEAKLEI